MKTTSTNKQAIALINKAFDADGCLVNPKNKTAQKQAKQLLDANVCVYGETVNGYDVHNCLLIIAYPNKQL
jgi:hypothetical protein